MTETLTNDKGYGPIKKSVKQTTREALVQTDNLLHHQM